MRHVHAIMGYKTSRDYALLWKMAQKQSVVCLVDYPLDTAAVCRDIAHTICHVGVEVSYLNISARGIGYVSAETLEEFERNCKAANVEFILPEETPK